MFVERAWWIENFTENTNFICVLLLGDVRKLCYKIETLGIGAIIKLKKIMEHLEIENFKEVAWTD